MTTVRDHTPQMQHLLNSLGAARREVLEHPLYAAVTDLRSLRTFMSSHVYAVWDFMSLLKSLQRQLTCVRIPWTPSPSRIAARLINEIVLGEESDEIGEGEYLSHYELYLRAMRELNVDCTPVERFVSRARQPMDSIAALLEEAAVTVPVRKFMLQTFAFVESPPHECASAFLFGREDLVPDMFERLLNTGVAPRESSLRIYLERHIHVDSEQHSPAGRRLLSHLCGEDARRWREATAAALRALAARKALWDAIFEQLQSDHFLAESTEQWSLPLR